MCRVGLQWRKSGQGGEKVSYLSDAERVGIRKIHEGDRGSAGGDLINFPFCLVNLRKREILSRARIALSIFYRTLADSMRVL